MIRFPMMWPRKILRFARGAVAAGWMKNKAYVNIGAVTMGIAGSFCDAGVLQKYFGIRAEWVDEVEILRHISIGIYDHDEYEKALAWVRENCKGALIRTSARICRLSSQSRKSFQPTKIGSLSSR